MEDRIHELKVKRICRFCMTQKEPLTNIYSRENRLKNSTVPLPLQIMAVTSIEVFTNDGMPANICEQCRQLMQHSYRFKQICKKSDTMLKQYPLTGTWPVELDLPSIPKEVQHEKVPIPLKRPAPKAETISPPVKKTREVIMQPEMVVLNSSPKINKPVKLLNKSAPTILNKNIRAKKEAFLNDPIIKTDEQGNVEIITELLDSVESYEEPDNLKFAPPVQTNVFSCRHCERSFPLRQLLDIHMKNHTRERTSECSICMKRFFSKYDLGKHMLIHTGEKPFQCVVCNKCFSRSTLLHRHEKVHTDQPRFLCIYCEKSFLSQIELDRHTNQHKKNRPFSCKICGKCFAFKQGCERHEIVHAKEQPNPCEYCDQSFTTPSKLARHLTAHAGDRPYPCKLCSKSFLLSHHLTRHLRSHSAGTGPYKCIDCESVFTSRDDLIYHSAVHATQNLVCPLCKEQFDDLDCVTEHIKSHTLGEQCPCDYCDLIFTTAEKLETHCVLEHCDFHKGNELNIKIERNTEDMSGNEYVLEEIGAEIARDNVSIRSYNKQDNFANNTIKTYKTKKIQKYNENAVKNVSDEVLAEFEIRRSTRTNRGKDYAQMIKMEIGENDDDDDNAIIDTETEDEDDDDEFILGDQDDDDDDEEEVEKIKPDPIPISPPKPPIKQVKAGGSQEKITKFLKLTDKDKIRIDKNESVQNVLKNLPKGVTISKKDVGKDKKNEKEKEKEKPIQIDKPKAIEIQLPIQKVLRKSNPISQVSPKQIRKSAEIKKITSPPTEKSEIETQKRLSNSSVRKNSNNETPPKSAEANSDEKKQPTKLIEMKIGDKMVMVQKIMMTKDQVNCMKKEGKIEMKDGTMLFKPVAKNLPKIPKKK